MTTRGTRILLPALAALLLIPTPALAGKLFDGEEKSIVFVGYSTSYRWPNILEHMINRQFEHKIVYYVLNAAEGGAPVGTWIAEPGSRDHTRSYERMLEDWFIPLEHRSELKGYRRLPNVPRPTVAILQQSLQRTSPIIRGPGDTANIKAGADAMQKLVEALHADGVELIFVTTHIYKYTHEPQVEHEKYALAELLKRGIPYVYPGPDVWAPSREQWPQIFTQPDQVHLNKKGDSFDARQWHELLMRYDSGELQPTLDSAWGTGWQVSITNTKGLKQVSENE